MSDGGSLDPLGDNVVTVVYKAGDGRLGERVILRSNDSELQIASAGRPWRLDADGGSSGADVPNGRGLLVFLVKMLGASCRGGHQIGIRINVD